MARSSDGLRAEQLPLRKALLHHAVVVRHQLTIHRLLDRMFDGMFDGMFDRTFDRNARLQRVDSSPA